MAYIPEKYRMKPPIPEEKLYKYTPLPTNRSIRLLRITSLPLEPLTCTLEIVDLDTNPSYDCLSYTWADPLYQKFWPEEDQRLIHGYPKYEIGLDNHGAEDGEGGKRIRIAENLYEALTQLCVKKAEERNGRDPGYEKQGRIWIDAMCINQMNGAEVKGQVDMMRVVYGKARNVVVWLGPDDPQLDIAIDVLGILASVPEAKLEGIVHSDLYDSEIYDILGIKSWHWPAFAAFLLRGWFSRIWVIQETWAASNIIVFVASYTLQWAQITTVMRILNASKLDRLLNEQIERTVNGVGAVTRYIGNSISNQFIFAAIIENKKSLDLERLLAYSRYFKATNAEDRVFAVRGMWTPGPRLEGQKAIELIPKIIGLSAFAIEETYTTASVVAMHEMGDLNLLSLVEEGSTRKLKRLPSWVPDYSVTPLLEPLQGIPRPNPGDERWNASKGVEWIKPTGKGGNLQVRGIYFDDILEFAASEVEITDKHAMHTVLTLLKTALDIGGGAYSVEMFWKALIKDTFRGEEADKEAKEAFPLLFVHQLWKLRAAKDDIRAILDDSEADTENLDFIKSVLVELVDAHSKTQSLISDLSSRPGNYVVWSWEKALEIIETKELPESMQKNFVELEDRFREAYVGRRMFRTKTNHLGIAAQSIEQDDEIWILAGASVPMVLRQVAEGEYRLVGEAYIHGIMKGELVGKSGQNIAELLLV